MYMNDMQQYCPISIRHANKELVDKYFNDLMATPFAQMRFQFWEPVNLKAIETYIYDPYNMVYMIGDNENNKFCGEITFNNFCHRSAFIHFSLHPDYIRTRFRKEYRKMLNFFLTEGDLKTLIAWIPLNNKAAQVFAENLGFEYQCEIPNSAFIARDKNTIPCKQYITSHGGY